MWLLPLPTFLVFMLCGEFGCEHELFFRIKYQQNQFTVPQFMKHSSTEEPSCVTVSAVKRFRTSGPVCTHSCVFFHFLSLVSMADRQRLPRRVGEDRTDRFSPINTISTYSILDFMYSQSTTNVLFPPLPH